MDPEEPSVEEQITAKKPKICQITAIEHPLTPRLGGRRAPGGDRGQWHPVWRGTYAR